MFDRAPRLVYREVTRACDLACRHCWADAIRTAHPAEFSPPEGMALLEEVLRFGDPPPHVVLTGGDPLRRADLGDLIAHGRRLGLEVSLSPSVIPLLQAEVLADLKRLGVQTISLSLDSAAAATHDGIRGIPGCFARTLEMARAAVAEGLNLQINTLVAEETVAELGDVYRLVACEPECPGGEIGVGRQGPPVSRRRLFFARSIGGPERPRSRRCGMIVPWTTRGRR